MLIQVTPVPTRCKTEAACFTALLVASIVKASRLSRAKVERRSAVALPVVVRCDAGDLNLPLRNNARRSPAARRVTSRPTSTPRAKAEPAQRHVKSAARANVNDTTYTLRQISQFQACSPWNECLHEAPVPLTRSRDMAFAVTLQADSRTSPTGWIPHFTWIRFLDWL